MAPELDMGMGMGMGLGMGMMPMGMTGMEAAASSSFSTAYMCGLPSADAMRVDDLLDFSNQDDLFDAAAAASAAGPENHQAHLLPLHEPPAAAGNLDASAPHLSSFSDDLYIPSEEAAELEWLSKFVDDSFSDVPFLSSHGGVSSGEPVPSSNSGVLGTDPSAVRARARSKRSRLPATALQHTISTWCSPPPFQPQSSSSTTSSASASASSSSSSSEFPPGGANSKPSKAAACRKKEAVGAAGAEGGVRRCTHCSSEKTPQWRTGPLGPKTLCNACGVRYKSGRLVPEYRPAASPTFVLTQHSNSHRKVMELRRQKEHLLRQHAAATTAPSAAVMSPSPRPELLFRDYEVC
ncbi:hypothetical protein Taro_028352 [Colocasia esculenta]|uniref:GATA-type domain-containing protein n=1 Tax=Colocasia esculenta TaxID=4460 RepID=A0A843VKU9_COLES|nr:hypothetical protein [Colocasia esculenta]